MHNKIKQKNLKTKPFKNALLIKDDEILLIDLLKKKLNLPSRRQTILFALKKILSEL